MADIESIVITFDNKIGHKEVPLLRGATINAMERRNVLFHNHVDDGFRLSYPLVQYKRLSGKAAIVCIGEATIYAKECIDDLQGEIRLGRRTENLKVDGVYLDITDIEPGVRMYRYRLYDWLPLNGDNYKTYKETYSIIDRYQMLEDILTANVLSMAKGLGVYLEDKAVCRLTEVTSLPLVTYKGVKMMSFEVEFVSNMLLPEYIGLGKGCSIGHGVIERLPLK